MFTGIVTGVGRVRSIRRGDGGADLEIEAPYRDLVAGESVAIDGTCLTVTEPIESGFRCHATAETLGLTTLGRARSGGVVNLERALQVGDRLGGHLVTGHVDGLGSIRAIDPIGDGAVRVVVSHPPELARFVARKGSIAMDGVSLTVNGVGDGVFDVVLIPHTREVTTLGAKSIGDPINLEIDVVARYVVRSIEVGGAA